MLVNVASELHARTACAACWSAAVVVGGRCEVLELLRGHQYIVCSVAIDHGSWTVAARYVNTLRGS